MVFAVFRRAEFHDALTSLRAFLIGGSWNLPLRLCRKPFSPCRDFAPESWQRQFPSMLPSSFHFDEASRFDATGRLHQWLKMFMGCSPHSFLRVQMIQIERAPGSE